MRQPLMLIPASLFLALGACGGDDEGGSADCIEFEVADDFIDTVRLSTFVEAGEFVNDPPLPADAVLVETGVGPDGTGSVATFTTSESKSSMTPIYQSTIGSCDNAGRISGGEVDTWQTDTGEWIVRADYQDGRVTISELPS